jgi:hypothetical protein
MQNETREFLELLFDGVPGFIEIRAFKKNEPPHIHMCETIDDAEYFVGVEEDLRRDVYVGVATRRDPSIGGTKSNLSHVRCVWCDVDGLWGEGAREEFDERLTLFRLEPSIRVWSGGGYHLYWLLENVLSVRDSEAQHHIESINLGLARLLGGDKQAFDATRIMRVAGTMNWKSEAGRTPNPARILH